MRIKALFGLSALIRLLIRTVYLRIIDRVAGGTLSLQVFKSNVQKQVVA